MSRRLSHSQISTVSAAGLLITLGIVFGDLGTSPLYVMRAIVAGADTISTNFILGGLSAIFWTLTLQTTLKYIIITLRADNKGEGGIFSLFALLRKKAKWAYLFAIIGGCALLADGVITPSITIVSAVEGLININPRIPVIPIVIVIITALFFIQGFGTKAVGGSFGPIMMVWFLMLGTLGFVQILHFPAIFKAINPYYAYLFIAKFPHGFVLLGAVFLCTTGAEALYSDLGHCGLKNIRISWVFVKTALLLNYFGQGAWILNNAEKVYNDTNPFFAIMPAWFPDHRDHHRNCSCHHCQPGIDQRLLYTHQRGHFPELLAQDPDQLPDQHQRTDVHFQYQLDPLCLLPFRCFVFPEIIQHGSCLWLVNHHNHVDDHIAPQHLYVLSQIPGTPHHPFIERLPFH